MPDLFLPFSESFSTVIGASIPRYLMATNGQTVPGPTGVQDSMPGQLHAGDFNGDGLDDLVVTFADTFMEPLFYFANGDGTFTFEDVVPPEAARRHIRNAAVVDLDADGDLDFVGFTAPHPFYQAVLGASWDIDEPLLILRNEGASGFRHIDGFPDSAQYHGGAVGDLNGDGLMDVFGIPESSLWNDQRRPFVQTHSGTFTPALQGFGSEFALAMTSDMRIGDLNGDGKMDFVVATSAGNGNGRPIGTPMYASEFGTFRYAYGDGTLNLESLRWRTMGTHWMSSADWAAFLEKNEANPAGSVPQYLSGPSNIELLDVNGDGRLDILVGLMVSAPFRWVTGGFKYYENQGTGFLDRTDQVFPNQAANRNLSDPIGFILGFRLADLNNDGRPDLVIANKSVDRGGMDPDALSLSLFINQGGTYEPMLSRSLDFSIGGWAGLGTATVGDFNGDGFADLTALTNNNTEWLLGVHLNLGLNAARGDQRLIGGADDDLLQGGPGWDLLQGGPGDDALIGGAGNDRLDGGSGRDVVRYSGKRSAYQVVAAPAGSILVSGPEGEDTFIAIERAVFEDKALAFDVEGIGGKTYRLYKAAYDRVPDAGGVGFWMHYLDNGFDMLTAANNFLNSAEFRAMYDRDPATAGYQEPNIELYVKLVYQHVLQRDPSVATDKDHEGYQFWVGAMYNKAGAYGHEWSRGEILLQFAESNENKANVIGVIQDGFEYTPFTPS